MILLMWGERSGKSVAETRGRGDESGGKDAPTALAAPDGAGNLGALPADARVMQPQMLFDPLMDKNAFSVLLPKD